MNYRAVCACVCAVLVSDDVFATLLYNQSFEDPTYPGTTYFDTGDAATDHWLTNNPGEAVVNGVGFTAWYGTTGGVGLTDGDEVGVTNDLGITGGMFDGLNAYQMSDTDGVMRLLFDDYGNGVNVSVAIFIANTGYENGDHLTISYGIDVLLELGNGSDGGTALEAASGTWLFLEAYNVSGQLTIETATNSSAEAVLIDAVDIWTGSIPAPGSLALLGIACLMHRFRNKR